MACAGPAGHAGPRVTRTVFTLGIQLEYLAAVLLQDRPWRPGFRVAVTARLGGWPAPAGPLPADSDSEARRPFDGCQSALFARYYSSAWFPVAVLLSYPTQNSSSCYVIQVVCVSVTEDLTTRIFGPGSVMSIQNKRATRSKCRRLAFLLFPVGGQCTLWPLLPLTPLTPTKNASLCSSKYFEFDSSW